MHVREEIPWAQVCGFWPTVPGVCPAMCTFTPEQCGHGGAGPQMSHRGPVTEGAVVVKNWREAQLAFFPELIPKVKILAFRPEHGVRNCQCLGNERQQITKQKHACGHCNTAYPNVRGFLEAFGISGVKCCCITAKQISTG